MTKPQAAQSGWLNAQEVGSVLGMRLLIFIATTIGRWPVTFLLRFIAFYYALVARKARAASRDYLRRMGRPFGLWAVYEHVLRFAQCIADRPLLITGRTAAFAIETHGSEHLMALHRQKRGAILLGAHLGSFEALHAQAGHEALTVNVVGFFKNAPMLNRVLESLNGQLHARLLEPGSGIELALRLRECVERGEFVAILGDRDFDGNTVEVEFLGGRARFPKGPLALASVLRCPVLLTFGLYHPPNRYALYCEPFTQQVQLPRAGREEALREHVQHFATRLEHYCRLAPDNWFNFYDFWSPRA